jgi:glucose-6-phosphate isomerase
MSDAKLISDSQAWKSLEAHAKQLNKLHLRNLLDDEKRVASLSAEFDGIFLDFARQKVTEQTMNLLFDLAEEADLTGKIKQMADGEHINTTEDRAVMHIALRARADDTYTVDGKNVVPDVDAVRQRIRTFSDEIRSGTRKGVTGKPITNVIAIGIGGSYLGAEFVAESMRTDAKCSEASAGRNLRFLANVDPIDVKRALAGLSAENTLAVIVSKTFTTAETMLNARTIRHWLKEELGDNAETVKHHMIALSSAIPKVKAFGIDEQNIFGFWDWVGGRYSVTAAVGLMPLALQFGWENVEQFLEGARSIDQHFITASPRENLPILLGLLGIWNSSFLGHPARALACYCQALLKLAPHIQQVDMESNGKRVTQNGTPVPFATGEINFGEPGTNGQHSFFQLFHQGRVVPADFIGFVHSQNPIEHKDEPVSNHDELMSNFFAQPDALACGRTLEEAKAAGANDAVAPHKVMPGDRPSNVLLLPKLTPYSTGQLLALYEHRTAVQGMVWGLNSFDQMGVELGKVLATNVREQLRKTRKEEADITGFNPSTTRLLKRYTTKQ